MKILFKNNTKYTKEKYNAFIEFHKKKYGKKILIKLTLILVCLIYIIVFNIINKNWRIIILLFFIAIILYFLNNTKQKKQSSNNKKIITKQKAFTFYFYEKYIKIKCGRKFDRLKYFELYKIFETKDYFFLYTDEEHSLIISKDGFEIGNAKEFTNFIKKKCLFKYRKDNKGSSIQ